MHVCIITTTAHHNNLQGKRKNNSVLICGSNNTGNINPVSISGYSGVSRVLVLDSLLVKLRIFEYQSGKFSQTSQFR